MKLYYIGNGFDLSHNLPTKYINFKDFFKKNYPEKYFDFIAMYDLGQIYTDYGDSYYDDSDTDEIIQLWTDFENTLGKVRSSYIENQIEAMQEARDITKGEFRGILTPDPAWYRQTFIEKLNLCDLYTPLQKAFQDWITDVEANNSPDEPENTPTPFFPISNDNSYFVVFNYTHTLQKMYHIQEENISYPHGEVGNNGNPPKFGHGNSTIANEIKKDDTYNYDSDSHYILDWISDYLEKTQKRVDRYVQETSSSLRNLPTDENIEINVMGCSFNQIDAPYFISAYEIFPNASWNISYHSPEDKENIQNFCRKNFNVPNDRIKLIKL